MLPDMEMTMNSQSSALAHYYSAGDGHHGGGGSDGFLGMLDDRHRSSGDLFDLVWRGGGVAGGSRMDVRPSLLVPSSSSPAAALPPSEDEMAAWLHPIVRGDELVFTGQDDHHHPGDLAGHAAAAVEDQQAAAPVKETADHKRREDKLPKMGQKQCRPEDQTSFRLSRKAIGGARKSHNAETHRQTEKRRRCKINDKFKTLQQLVPGCHKSNQVSTLDQTIQYIKSLQQQIQAMSFGCGVKTPPAVYYPVVAPPPYLPSPSAGAGLMTPPPAAAAAAAPGVLVRAHVRPEVVLAPSPAMAVPFGALLPLVHHPHKVSCSSSCCCSECKLA